MKIAAPPRRSRLFALCGLSAAMHLLVLSLVAKHGPGARSAESGAGLPLVVRLAPLPAAEPGAAASVASAAASAPSASAASAATPRRPPRSAAPVMNVPAATPAPAPSAQTTVPAGAPAPGGEPGAQPLSLTMSSLRPHYQIATPGAVRLVYQVSDGAAPARSGPAAYLEWRSDGSAYVLEMDGVLGRRSSSGVIGDDGIVPQRARAWQGERMLDTTFDPLGQRVTLADGAEAAAQPGTLDGAMVWIWLASVANASAGQLRDRIGVNVADTDGVHALRFDVVGEEEVDTGVGRLKTWHLAQYAPPGEARVDAWLAPQQDWLPVVLRVTRADGGVATQVLQRREAASEAASAP